MAALVADIVHDKDTPETHEEHVIGIVTPIAVSIELHPHKGYNKEEAFQVGEDSAEPFMTRNDLKFNMQHHKITLVLLQNLPLPPCLRE